MQITIPERHFNIRALLVSIPVRFFHRDNPDRKHIVGDFVTYAIEPLTGNIINGPFEDGVRTWRIDDEGVYTLSNMNHSTVAMLRGDYVPACLPRRNGDTDSLMLEIRGNRVVNLPTNPTFSEFFFSTTNKL